MDEFNEIIKKGKQYTDSYLYYVLIVILSLLSLLFLPFVTGSSVNIAPKLPKTIIGWVVWVFTKVSVATVNLLLFIFFMRQAKVNVRDNEQFKEANRMMNILSKGKHYRSPEEWKKQTYGKKGLTIFFTSALSVFALTNALLSFDIIQFLTYLFTIVMGLIWGIFQMKVAEEYWTDEYYNYALQLWNANNEATTNDNSMGGVNTPTKGEMPSKRTETQEMTV